MPSYLAAASNARSYITAATMVAGRAPVTSVLICDDRPAVLCGLSEMLGPLRPVIDNGVSPMVSPSWTRTRQYRRGWC
jgi:hypothetical protein